jgi:DNA-binding NarL/FixJ family response regulator
MRVSVLIVDDDHAFWRLAGRLLAAACFEVIGHADSAHGALSAARALEPRAVLVDVGLPDRDGISLACELTALPWRPRVLLTSVDADAASRDDLRRSGAAGFVQKAELPTVSLRALLAPE